MNKTFAAIAASVILATSLIGGMRLSTKRTWRGEYDAALSATRQLADNQPLTTDRFVTEEN